jgi:hypothetical protein
MTILNERAAVTKGLLLVIDPGEARTGQGLGIIQLFGNFSALSFTMVGSYYCHMK